MKAGWTNTRANGQPLEPGTFAYVVDPEDGTHPVYTYGSSQDEVMEKIALQSTHANAAIADLKKRAVSTSTPLPPPAKAPTADDVMLATQNLDNPAKSGAAVSTLFHAATGIDPQRLVLQNFKEIAERWEDATAEFDNYRSPGNRRLIAIDAQALAGGSLAAVTAEHLTRAFESLRLRGFLAEVQAPAPQPSDAELPDGSQVQPRERPRGIRFATGARSTSFQRGGPSQRKANLKYTEEQIRTMPIPKSEQLIRDNDPDYAAACEAYFGSPAKATA